jgi:hypothetical protein
MAYVEMVLHATIWTLGFLWLLLLLVGMYPLSEQSHLRSPLRLGLPGGPFGQLCASLLGSRRSTLLYCSPGSRSLIEG